MRPAHGLLALPLIRDSFCTTFSTTALRDQRIICSPATKRVSFFFHGSSSLFTRRIQRSCRLQLHVLTRGHSIHTIAVLSILLLETGFFVVVLLGVVNHTTDRQGNFFVRTFILGAEGSKKVLPGSARLSWCVDNARSCSWLVEFSLIITFGLRRTRAGHTLHVPLLL